VHGQIIFWWFMTGKPDPHVQWRHTAVVLRADILKKAQELGINISDECNRALADITGIDYRQQQLSDAAPPKPVIIAPDAAPAVQKDRLQKQDTPRLPPVINADDPSAPAKVIRAQRSRPAKPATEGQVPPSPPHTKKDDIPASPGQKARPAGRGKKPAPQKKKKEDVLKRFVAQKLARTDADDAVIGKDALYQTFSRWCREHRVAPVPDRKVFAVALKNQFAFREKSMEGTPCWTGVRLK
jgi:hypothetical protein